MSMLPVARRSMRIIALPLTSATRTPDPSYAGQLTYYQFMTPPRKEEKNNWMHWVTGKAADLWAGFGNAKETHWKRKVFLYGERLIDRIDFEELALKSLDPSLGPKISRFGHTEPNVKPEDHPRIPLIYPSSVCPSPLAHLQTLLSKRTPRHKRGFYTWMIIAPFTAPFMIIPIIPNLPFFFCVWRSWSHYRAYKASSYLEKVLERGAIIPEASPELDALYTQYAPPLPPLLESEAQESQEAKPPSSSSSSPSPEERPELADASSTAVPESESKGEGEGGDGRKLLLTRDAVPALTALFHLEASFAPGVYRALEQARLRIERVGANGQK